MKKIKISYNKKSKLINELEKKEYIEVLNNKSFFSKLIFSKKEFADVHFHFGTIDNILVDNIKNAKKVIVNSNAMMHKLIVQLKLKETSKIEVIYPSIDVEYKAPKLLKKQLGEQLNLVLEKKVIFFTAKNFEKSGIKEFLSIISSLKSKKFQVLVAGDKKQITTIKFKISNLAIYKEIIFIEDYKNIDELFLIADIFILPTHRQFFAYDILKAMFCKCAVFVPSQNHASELVDIFATLDGVDDRATYFKIDALLDNEEDLKIIKKQNRKLALQYTLENNLGVFRKIMKNLNLN